MSGCIEQDQRGIDRVIGSTLTFDPSAKNTCEIGSVEIRRLTAADITDLQNKSLVELNDFYQENIDDLEEIIADKNTPEKNPTCVGLAMRDFCFGCPNHQYGFASALLLQLQELFSRR